MKRVFLIRHGEAEFSGHGRGDHGRVLTEEGREQARHLGELLANAGIELVLASTADRAAQTAAGLGLEAPIRLNDDLYSASTLGIMRVLAEIAPEMSTVAVVAHAPGIPALVEELAGEESDPDAVGRIRHRFSTATAAGIGFTGSWADLDGARLIWSGRG